MKLFTALFLLSSLTVLSQDQTLIGKNYITITDQIKVYGVKDDGTIDETVYFYMSKNTKFSITDITKDKNLQIELWDYTAQSGSTKPIQKSEITAGDLTDYASHDKSYVGIWANSKKFILTLADLNSKCQLYYGKERSFVWGAISLPVKLKFGNGSDRLFNTQENLNLGLSFGLKKQMQGRHIQSLNYLVFAAIGSVSADSASLKPDNTGTPTPPPSSGIAPAFSFGAGLVYQYQSEFQAGVFIGFDDCTNSIGRIWKYQGRPWIGIGLGISLFSVNGTQSTGKNTQAQN